MSLWHSRTRKTHDNGTMGDSRSDTDSNPDFDSVFDSNSNPSPKSHDDPDASPDNESESSASPDTESDAGHNPGSSNELDTGPNTKAKITASGNDIPESTVLQRTSPVIRLLRSMKIISLLQMTRFLPLILPLSLMIRWPGLSCLPQWWLFPSLCRRTAVAR